MALYEFICNFDQVIETVKAPMAEGPTPPVCLHCDQPMTRRYNMQAPIVMLDMRGYIDKAYSGKELPAGMNRGQVRTIVDAQVSRARKGRRNSHDYGDRRRIRPGE